MKPTAIAIDGPAGAGKSTISKAAAKALGFLYIDTGAMYRSVGVAALNLGADTDSEEDILKVLNDISLEIKMLDDGQHIFLNEVDFNDKIRTPEASMAASAVAKIPAVRLKLVEIQREIAKNNNVIMDGRDIGSYVLPDAKIKIFLTASVEERAKRRYQELLEQGENCTLSEVISDMQLRDKQDSERSFAPLKKAEDAILFDTTGLSLPESVEKIIDIVRERR